MCRTHKYRQRQDAGSGNFGGFYVGMAKLLLYRANICTRLQ